jgi:hypothetical protein
MTGELQSLALIGCQARLCQSLNSCLCFEPVHCRGHAEDAHEGTGGLFVSGGNGTPLFQP